MPYETLLDEVLDTLSPLREVHRSAVVASVEELRGVLAAHRGSGDDRGVGLGRELGPFAGGRIETGALAAVLSLEEKTLAPGAVEVIERALAVMTETADDLDEATVVQVPEGGDLRDVVRDALTSLGVVFGAARAAELARTGAYRPEDHNVLFSGRPFHRWTPAERGIAPPLVVTVDGADLRPAGLADFLDGSVKIVLRVRGRAPAAALSRVVTPGVTVLQTRDASDLEAVASAPGPALAALFDADAEGPVTFRHDPGAGDLPWERLMVDGDLDELEAGLSTFRRKDRTQAEDLAHLVALARRPAGTGAAEGSPVGDDEEAAASGVDQLAAWLLASTDI